MLKDGFAIQVFQTQLRKGYSINDLKADIAVLYTKAGLKNIPITYLMTDSQVAEEKFLVVINDMLASGDITDLFPDDQIDGIISAMMNEVIYSYLHQWCCFCTKKVRCTYERM